MITRHNIVAVEYTDMALSLDFDIIFLYPMFTLSRGFY